MGKLLLLLSYLVDVIYKLKSAFRRKELTDAKEEAIQKDDQRPIEKALGGEAGPSRLTYFGMFRRTRENKERSVEDKPKGDGSI